MLDVDQMDELVLLNTLSRPPVLILLTSLREAEEGHSQQSVAHAASHQLRLPRHSDLDHDRVSARHDERSLDCNILTVPGG